MSAETAGALIESARFLDLRVDIGVGPAHEPKHGRNVPLGSERSEEWHPYIASSSGPSRVTPVHTALRNCTRDEGGPFELGNQVSSGASSSLFQSRVSTHLSLSATARSTPFTFITPGPIIGASNPVEVLFTLIVVLRTVLQVPSEFFLKSSHVRMTVGFGAHAAAKIANTAVASARIVRISFRQSTA
jgi:hypothetical protein